MDPSVLLQTVSQLGLGGIVFIIWNFDNKKITSLQDVVKEQIEDKKVMRLERTELIRIIREQAVLLESVKRTQADIIRHFSIKARKARRHA